MPNAFATKHSRKNSLLGFAVMAMTAIQPYLSACCMSCGAWCSSTCFLVHCQDVSQGVYQLFVCCKLRLYLDMHRWYSQEAAKLPSVGPDCACEKLLSELRCMRH